MNVANGLKKHFVRIQGEDAASACGEGECVLDALERDGRSAVRVGCRRGGCGACRVHVVSGRYDTMKMSRAHVTEEEEAQGFALCCRLLAKSDLVLAPAFVGPRRPTDQANM